MDIEFLNFLELMTGVALPVFEIFLAVWLVLKPSTYAIATGFLLFSIYASYLIRTHWIGGVSCPCMGNGYSNVLFVLGLDFIALACLLMQVHGRNLFKSKSMISVLFLQVPAATLLWMLNPDFANAVANSMNPGPLRTELQQFSNVPAVTDFHASVTISNRTRHAVAVDQFLLSCGCTKFTPEKMTLEPGQAATMQLTVDLNKSFGDAQSRTSQIEVSAGCFDDKMNELDQIRLFSASCERTFAPKTSKITHSWQDSTTVNMVTIPIVWFKDSVQNILEVCIDGQPVRSELVPEGVQFNLSRPNKPFSSFVVKLSHQHAGDRFDSNVTVDVVYSPTILALNDNSVGSSSMNVTSLTTRDVQGEIISKVESASELVGQNALAVARTRSQGGKVADVTIYFESLDGFVQTLVVPFVEPQP